VKVTVEVTERMPGAAALTRGSDGCEAAPPTGVAGFVKWRATPSAMSTSSSTPPTIAQRDGLFRMNAGIAEAGAPPTGTGTSCAGTRSRLIQVTESVRSAGSLGG